MVQTILALGIFFSALTYSVFAILRNLLTKKTSGCGGCAGCEFKHSLKKMQKKKLEPGNLKYLPKTIH